jgi:hypothetical protein
MVATPENFRRRQARRSRLRSRRTTPRIEDAGAATQLRGDSIRAGGPGVLTGHR